MVRKTAHWPQICDVLYSNMNNRWICVVKLKDNLSFENLEKDGNSQQLPDTLQYNWQKQLHCVWWTDWLVKICWLWNEVRRLFPCNVVVYLAHVHCSLSFIHLFSFFSPAIIFNKHQFIRSSVQFSTLKLGHMAHRKTRCSNPQAYPGVIPQRRPVKHT